MSQTPHALCAAAQWGVFIPRVALGVIVLASGLLKLGLFGGPGITSLSAGVSRLGLPAATVVAAVWAFAEVVAGLGLLVGLGTRLWALVYALIAVASILAVRLSGGFFLPAGIEYKLLLAAVSVGYLLTGAQAIALDTRLRSR